VTSASPPPPPAPTTPVPPEVGVACGGLGCLELDTPRQAFELALRGDPLVIAVGEAHAQKGGAPVPSTVRRFGAELLPALAGRAKDLVIELVVPDKKCRQAETEAVRERTREVTKPQAEGNQNEFVALGFRAKELGIRPEPLVPTCDELASVVKAGEGDIHTMLGLVADITTRETIAFLSHGDPARSVVTYGGLIHNDIEPRAGRESWSFGPRLDRHVGGRYVEIDLIVPEAIQNGEPWRSLPWFVHYDAARHGAKTVLFRPGPRSFVLVFPRTLPENVTPGANRDAPTPSSKKPDP